MSFLNPRLNAFAGHLVISFLISLAAAFLVFGIWYPYPYREISGGRELFFLMVAVDVVVGPLITLIIFNKNKNRKHLLMDFLVIGFLQVVALTYGLWTVFSARPIHLVFEYHRIAVVHAIDVDLRSLEKAPPPLQNFSITGPTLISLRPFKDGNEELDSTLAALGGFPQAAQPALWQPWSAARVDILRESRSLTELKQRFPAHTALIDSSISATGRSADNLRYLPMFARKQGWTVFIDAKTTMPVSFLPIDSF